MAERRFTSREVRAALEAVIRYERGRARRLLVNVRSELERQMSAIAITAASRETARDLEKSVTREVEDA